MSSKVFKQLLERVQVHCTRFDLLPRDEPLAVGVSGGADSTALLLVLHRLAASRRMPLHVFHFDHRMQSVSRTHARFVCDLARRLNLPFHLGRWTDFSKAIGFQGQAAARRARLSFFADKSAELGINYVALAHTADDQAETLLWRLVRGSAPGSLAGMRPRQRQGELVLIRPLLATQRRQIEAFLQAEGQGFCDDPSNQKTHYLRNRIRHELLPFLEMHFNPKIREHLYSLCETWGAEHRLLDQMSRRWIRQHLPSRKKAGAFRVESEILKTCPDGLRLRVYVALLRRLPNLHLAEIKLAHLRALDKMVFSDGPAILALPSGWSIEARKKGQGKRLLAFEPKAHQSPKNR